MKKQWMVVISLVLIVSGIFQGVALAYSSSVSSIVSVSSGGIIQYVSNTSRMMAVKAVDNKLSVQLRGVNVEGMEYWPVAQTMRVNETPTRYANIKSLGFNVVRHPFAVDCYNYNLFYPDGHSKYVGMGYTGDLGVDYRQLITDITQWCLNNDLYIVWEPHRWIHDVDGSYDMQDITIYADTMRKLANQLNDFPNAIIGLANEPWDSSWAQFAQRGIDEVRSTGYTGLIVVPVGSQTINYFANNPPNDPLNNFCFDMHIYWYHRAGTPFTENTVDGAYYYLQSKGVTVLAETYPLIIGEFGAYDELPDELLFVENAMNLCEREGWGWMAWVYHPDTVTNFGMISNYDGTLNSYGQTVVSFVEQLAS